MIIPEPPRPPLSAPGDVLEGRVTGAERTKDSWGNDVLELLVETSTGTVRYTCNKRLWNLIGGGEVGRIRITRIHDSPAIGTKQPARNWTVERLPDQVAVPTAPVQPVSVGTLAW